MSVDPKVIAAISSAVGLFLQVEQKALPEEQLSPPEEQLSPPEQQLSPPEQQLSPLAPVVMSNPFALAGRQAAMNIRWTWQMRLTR